MRCLLPIEGIAIGKRMGMNAWIYGFISCGTVIGAACIIVLILQLIILLHKMRCRPILPCTSTKQIDPDQSKFLSKHYGRAFTFKEVEEACEGFINLLGESSFHSVYKGILADGTEVAVKKIKECAANNLDVQKTFFFQVDLLSNVRHPHLVNLIGFCDKKDHRILIFEYAPNGSLFNNLHADDEHLSWKQRIRIAVGIACGMSYLHQLRGSLGIHGDLTSDSVLLAEDYGAKISGIGTASVCLKSAMIKRDAGCTDPNLHEQTAKSQSEDVRSFGILILELVSGKLTFSKESGMIVEWAGQFLRSRDQMTLLMDPTLKDVVPLELYSVCEIACLCVQPEASSRPSMAEVYYMLVQTLGIGTEMVGP